jgi:hypothetical protein
VYTLRVSNHGAEVGSSSSRDAWVGGAPCVLLCTQKLELCAACDQHPLASILVNKMTCFALCMSHGDLVHGYR